MAHEHRKSRPVLRAGGWLRQALGRLSAVLLACCLGSAALAQGDNASYRFGPGDEISIKVFGEDDLSMTFRLNDNGRLNYPFLGEILVEGLTAGELEKVITRGLKDSYLLNPVVMVSVSEYRPFFLSGEVNKPGAIPYQPNLTIERAIVLGGGLTDFASVKKIYVIRAGDPMHQPVRVGLSDPVFPGDMITVKEKLF